jgi:hypothetical protein
LTEAVFSGFIKVLMPLDLIASVDQSLDRLIVGTSANSIAAVTLGYRLAIDMNVVHADQIGHRLPI